MEFAVFFTISVSNKKNICGFVDRQKSAIFFQNKRSTYMVLTPKHKLTQMATSNMKFRT